MYEIRRGVISIVIESRTATKPYAVVAAPKSFAGSPVKRILAAAVVAAASAIVAASAANAA